MFPSYLVVGCLVYLLYSFFFFGNIFSCLIIKKMYLTYQVIDMFIQANIFSVDYMERFDTLKRLVCIRRGGFCSGKSACK